MLVPVRSSRFKRDVKRARTRGKDVSKLRRVLGLLLEGKRLQARYRDHRLRGDWQGYRELHLEADWLLIYRVKGDELLLVRTGTHSDFFRGWVASGGGWALATAALGDFNAD